MDLAKTMGPGEYGASVICVKCELAYKMGAGEIKTQDEMRAFIMTEMEPDGEKCVKEIMEEVLFGLEDVLADES